MDAAVFLMLPDAPGAELTDLAAAQNSLTLVAFGVEMHTQSCHRSLLLELLQWPALYLPSFWGALRATMHAAPAVTPMAGTARTITDPLPPFRGFQPDLVSFHRGFHPEGVGFPPVIVFYPFTNFL